MGRKRGEWVSIDSGESACSLRTSAVLSLIRQFINQLAYWLKMKTCRKLDIGIHLEKEMDGVHAGPMKLHIKPSYRFSYEHWGFFSFDL